MNTHMKTQRGTSVRKPARLTVAALAPLLAAVGCTSVGPDYKAPVAAVPAEWRAAGDPAFSQQSTEISE